MYYSEKNFFLEESTIFDMKTGQKFELKFRGRAIDCFPTILEDDEIEQVLEKECSDEDLWKRRREIEDFLKQIYKAKKVIFHFI